MAIAETLKEPDRVIDPNPTIQVELVYPLDKPVVIEVTNHHPGRIHR